MNGRYGDGLLAFDQSRDAAWRILEYSAWAFITIVALWFLYRLLRSA